MIFAKQQKKSIYEETADVCRILEYIIKLDRSGHCCQPDFKFNKKIADDHKAMLAGLLAKVDASGEPNCDYAGNLITEIAEIYTEYRADRLSEDVISHAQIARLELATMSAMKSFTVSGTAEYLSLIKEEKVSINRTMSFLAGADDNGLFDLYTRYSDALNKYIEYLESNQNQENNEEHCITEEPVSVADTFTESYEDAKKISELTEQIRSLEYELDLRKNNEAKLIAALTAKEKEASDYAAKAAKAEKERSNLLTDIENVKREASAEGRMNIELPLLSITVPDDNVWSESNAHRGILQRFISPKGKKSAEKIDGPHIDAYACEVIGHVSNLIPEGDCPFIPGYAIYQDTSGRHYFIHKSSVSGSKATGSILDIQIGPQDLKLISYEFTDDEFKTFCSEHPSVCAILPDFYIFMTEVLKLSMYDGTSDTNAIIHFNRYYAHIYMIAKEFFKSRASTAIKALDLATELMLLFKCCGEKISSEASFVQDISRYLINDEKEMIQMPGSVKGMLSTSSESAEYLDELQKNILSFPHENGRETESADNEKNCINVTDKCSPITSEPAEVNIQIPASIQKTTISEKYSRTIIPDINNVKFIVSKISATGGEDTSSYAVENIDSAVGQYCFAIADVKKIGISIQDKRYFLMQSQSNAHSQLLLDAREKKFIKAEGVLDIVEFYEYKLLNAIRAAEE